MITLKAAFPDAAASSPPLTTRVCSGVPSAVSRSRASPTGGLEVRGRGAADRAPRARRAQAARRRAAPARREGGRGHAPAPAGHAPTGARFPIFFFFY
ncbi:hypothetical protein ACRAWF_36315, partial [Streptomyces sp. L7]